MRPGSAQLRKPSRTTAHFYSGAGQQHKAGTIVRPYPRARLQNARLHKASGYAHRTCVPAGTVCTDGRLLAWVHAPRSVGLHHMLCVKRTHGQTMLLAAPPHILHPHIAQRQCTSWTLGTVQTCRRHTQHIVAYRMESLPSTSPGRTQSNASRPPRHLLSDPLSTARTRLLGAVPSSRGQLHNRCTCPSTHRVACQADMGEGHR